MERSLADAIHHTRAMCGISTYRLALLVSSSLSRFAYISDSLDLVLSCCSMPVVSVLSLALFLSSHFACTAPRWFFVLPSLSGFAACCLVHMGTAYLVKLAAGLIVVFWIFAVSFFLSSPAR